MFYRPHEGWYLINIMSVVAFRFIPAGENMVPKPSDEVAQYQGTGTAGGRHGVSGTDFAHEKQP